MRDFTLWGSHGGGGDVSMHVYIGIYKTDI